MSGGNIDNSKHLRKIKFHSSQIRDDEAIKLAQEAIKGTKVKKRASSTPVKKSSRTSRSKVSSKTSLKKNSSIDKVYLNSNQVRSKSVPSKKSSIQIHPYRRPPSETHHETPKFRSLTRMEAYTGRGLYSASGKRGNFYYRSSTDNKIVWFFSIKGVVDLNFTLNLSFKWL